jgi:hypothetical protein
MVTADVPLLHPVHGRQLSPPDATGRKSSIPELHGAPTTSSATVYAEVAAGSNAALIAEPAAA